MTEDPMIAALLREREGFVQLDRPDCVADVDEQLRLRGYTPPADDKPAPGPAPSRSTPPKARRARRAETT